VTSGLNGSPPHAASDLVHRIPRSPHILQASCFSGAHGRRRFRCSTESTDKRRVPPRIQVFDRIHRQAPRASAHSRACVNTVLG